MLAENDLDRDPVIDVVKAALMEKYKFIEVSVKPFRCSLISEQQIQVCLTYAKNHKGFIRRMFLDATGSMLAKIGKTWYLAN